MKKSRVFIFPTLYGFIYGLGALLCLLVAAIYSNNLAYLLGFFLIALFIVGMHQSNNNLRKLSLEKVDLDLVPENKTSSAMIWIKSQNSQGNISVACKASADEDSIDSDLVEIPPHSQVPFPIRLKSKKMGPKKLKRITLFSRYPFGLFYVWRNFHLDHTYYSYPRPEGTLPLPSNDKEQGSLHKGLKGKGEDFRGHKAYRLGESQKKVDWKAYARTGDLFIKEFEDGNTRHILLSEKIIPEEKARRLRQISRWIFDCEEKRFSYDIELEGQTLSCGLGPTSRKKALRVLSRSGGDLG